MATSSSTSGSLQHLPPDITTSLFSFMDDGTLVDLSQVSRAFANDTDLKALQGPAAARLRAAQGARNYWSEIPEIFRRCGFPVTDLRDLEIANSGEARISRPIMSFNISGKSVGQPRCQKIAGFAIQLQATAQTMNKQRIWHTADRVKDVFMHLCTGHFSLAIDSLGKGKQALKNVWTEWGQPEERICVLYSFSVGHVGGCIVRAPQEDTPKINLRYILHHRAHDLPLPKDLFYEAFERRIKRKISSSPYASPDKSYFGHGIRLLDSYNYTDQRPVRPMLEDLLRNEDPNFQIPGLTHVRRAPPSRGSLWAPAIASAVSCVALLVFGSILKPYL